MQLHRSHSKVVISGQTSTVNGLRINKEDILESPSQYMEALLFQDNDHCWEAVWIPFQVSATDTTICSKICRAADLDQSKQAFVEACRKGNTEQSQNPTLMRRLEAGSLQEMGAVRTAFPVWLLKLHFEQPEKNGRRHSLVQNWS